jgi:hypothetical protein
MAKQIKRSEIAEQDLYRDIRDSAEKTITHINDLNESLSETATVLSKELKKPLKATIESISSVKTSVDIMNETMEHSVKLDKAKAQAIKTQIDAETKLEKLEQERIKTQIQENKLAQQELKISEKQEKQDKENLKLKQQLVEAEDEQVKAKIRYQKATSAQKKILADELILQDKQAGTLEKIAAQNRKLRREREKLNLETEEGKKRLKEINEELDDNNEVIKENSDALKKQKINVGNYEESIQNATGELGGMIKGIKDSINGIKAQAKAFVIQAKAADTSAKKIRLIGKAIKATGIGLLIAMLGALVSSMGDTREGVLNLQGTMQKAMALMSMAGQKVMDVFITMGLKIERLQLQAEEFFNGFGKTPEIQKRLKEIDNELEILSNKDYDISVTLDNIDDTIMKTFEYENALAKTSEEIEKLRGQEELLDADRGDMTLSFDQQRKAQEEYNKTVTERIKKEKELADMNVELQAFKVRQKLIEAGKQYSIEQVKNLEFLERESDWMKINSDALAELKDAKTEQIAKDNELASELSNNEKEKRNTLKDTFEKELDYAIDAFDIQKTINERIINGEKTTLAERETLTEETIRLADSAFANQVKLVQDYTKQRIDFDELLKMNDEAEIRRTLKKFVLNETTLTRILEILKERKTVVQDLAEIEDETANKRLEKNRAILDSIQNIEQDDFDLKIELLEREFDKEKELREKSLEDEKIKGEESVKQLKERLDEIKKIRIQQLKDQALFDREQVNEEVIEADEKAQKIEEINRKLQNDILRLENETLDAKKDIDEQEIENEEKKAEELADIRKQRVDDQIAVLQALTEGANYLADKRIAKIDEEINASQKRFDNLQELANNGNILAQQSMAEEAKLMAEQNRKREQMEKRKQRMQLASTVLQTYLTNSQDPEVKNPLQKTIADTILLTEFIKALPEFFEGTEDTGKNGQGVDGKGGFLSVLHPNERVLPKKNNDMIGNMSNDELSQLAYNYQNGLVRDITEGSIVSNGKNGINILVDKLDSLERTISNKPEHSLEVEQIIDGAMAITRSTKQGNTKVYNRYRVGR